MDGVRTVGHGDSANGRFAELLTVPERDFAVVAFSDDGPDGMPFSQAVVRWALRTCLGVTDRDPEPLPHDRKRAAEIFGRYESDAMTLTIGEEAAGLRLEVLIEPEIRAAADSGLPRPASSPAPGAARSWASTLPAGCSRGGRRHGGEHSPRNANDHSRFTGTSAVHTP
ncbi:hypothetical protein ACFVXE_15180 [Streptomyces sp. NPDC058231]|uniref:hypothetical protein n=1 Tax=Streptomyces sp. NPDC058231 TaxID=3346392 RepID=UPI0036E5BBE0